MREIHRVRRVRCECLEGRKLLSANIVNLGSGSLTYTGTATNNTIILSPGKVVVSTVTGTLIPSVSTHATLTHTNGISMNVTLRGTLLIQGTTGNDVIDVAASGKKKDLLVSINGQSFALFNHGDVKRIYVEGGAGKDTLSITGDPNIPTTLLGGDGNDVLKGGTGGETLIGGDGDDQIDAGQFGVLVATSQSTDNGKAGAIYNFIGTSEPAEGSLIIAGAGDDTITASPGPDTIFGGSGHDSITHVATAGETVTIDDVSPGDELHSVELIKLVSTPGNQLVVTNNVGKTSFSTWKPIQFVG